MRAAQDADFLGLGVAGFEFLDRGKLQCGGVRGCQNDLWSHTGIVGVFPSTRTQAPTVARSESRDFIFRSWCAEIISLFTRKLEECIGHDCADGVNSRISASCVTKTIPVVSSEGFVTAGFEIVS